MLATNMPAANTESYFLLNPMLNSTPGLMWLLKGVAVFHRFEWAISSLACYHMSLNHFNHRTVQNTTRLKEWVRFDVCFESEEKKEIHSYQVSEAGGFPTS